jgi:prepilin-type processing-associated H-X9-DG protein
MQTRRHSSERGDTSALDLLVMLIAAVIVAMVGLSYFARAHAMSGQLNCVNQMKQIGLSFRLWSGDNGDKFPMQVSTNNGGTMEYVRSGLVFPHFMVMSNELGTPKALVCPKDSGRTSATNFAALRDANVSYFVVPEADEILPDMWLSGDRNISTNGLRPARGVLMLRTNLKLNWTAQIHTNQGNLCFADGSVQQLNNAGLNRSATNALAAYYAATTNTAFRLAIP